MQQPRMREKHTVAYYKKQLDLSTHALLCQHVGINQLTVACKYALEGGKRLRPALALSICHALNPNVRVMAAATAIEFLHTASLIVDDLPCMDNDSVRRGRPSLYLQFGEAVAQLASVTLVSAAFRILLQNVDALEPAYGTARCNAIGMELMKNAAQNMGGLGAAGGQFMDRAMANATQTGVLSMPRGLDTHTADKKATLLELIHRKTSTFFETAMLVGWMMGGGSTEPAVIDQVKQSARAFGLAYQIADDLEDMEQDLQAAGGQVQRTSNYALHFGVADAVHTFQTQVTLYQTLTQQLAIDTLVGTEAVHDMVKRVKGFRAAHR